ncbi:MAG TPA: hypothetical protein VH933_12975 [Aestuariivirgaceae bacterium]|jgi:hypothetical protein
MNTVEQLLLSQAWELAGREANLWESWTDINSRVAEAEAKRPPLPLQKEELVRLFGAEWREKRKMYEAERDAVMGPLINRRASLREEINDSLRQQMTSGHWRAVGCPDDPIAETIDIEPEAWGYFDLGAIGENCVIFPRYFRRNETRKFIYRVIVTLAPASNSEGDPTSSPIRQLVLAIEKQMIPQTRIFNRQADLIREINRHLALSLETSAKHLNLAGDMKLLSADKRLALLRDFLRTLLPELGADLLNKMAVELLERKMLSDSLDRFNTRTLEEIAREALGHRVASPI